jgi:hypothetical protein
MDAVNFDERPAGPPDSSQAIRCEACDAALHSPSRDTISFLLFDQFTVPLAGCPDHLDQFSAVCGLTTEDSATLLGHRPAGGIPCPGCRHASHQSQQPVLPVGDGAVAVLACPRHQDEIIGRFRAGLQTRHHLTSTLPAR